MTVLFAAGTFLHYVFGIAMFLVSVFLILLVLVQRGRGGGLTGALGGMGGQSAFGAKAGDVFTRVTMVTAGLWIALCMGSIWLLNSQDEWQGPDTSNSGFSTPDSDGDQNAPSDDSAAGTVGDGEDGNSIGAVDAGSADEASGSSDAGSSSDESDTAEPPPTDSEGGEPPADEPESNS